MIWSCPVDPDHSTAAYADATLAHLGLPPLPASLPQSIAVLPDLFLQPTVPAFEYDYGALPPSLRFTGLLPGPEAEAPLPDWRQARDVTKRVVFPTQGTLANAEFDELIEPIATIFSWSRRPAVAPSTPCADQCPGRPVPAFGVMLPDIALLVTNGGYGSVSQALAAGVPIVSAGLTEDKAEIGARIGWSGAGLNLATNTPTVRALREAIDAALGHTVSCT